MARHSKEDAKTRSKVDELRQKAIEQFFNLQPKVMRHIEWSLSASLPCTACSKGKTEDGSFVHIPGKAIDTDGLCASCHGTYLVPDKNQRNWATVEAAERFAPKPKSVEMQVDQNVSVEDQKRELEKVSDADITTAAETLLRLKVIE